MVQGRWNGAVVAIKVPVSVIAYSLLSCKLTGLRNAPGLSDG